MVIAYRCAAIFFTIAHVRYWLRFLGYIPLSSQDNPVWMDLVGSGSAIYTCLWLAYLRERGLNWRMQPISEVKE